MFGFFFSRDLKREVDAAINTFASKKAPLESIENKIINMTNLNLRSFYETDP